MRIDFGRIMDYEDEICSYEGFLPLLLRAPFMKEHAKTLERAGLYDDVVAEEIMSRPMGFEEAVDEARLIKIILTSKKHIFPTGFFKETTHHILGIG